MAGGSGPLAGVRVVELGGLGPAPFGAMVLADLGAEILTVDRADKVTGADPATAKGNVYGRGRRSVGVDLKHEGGAAVVRRLTDSADVFIEGFRPGVAERLGIGPNDLTAGNPRLVYARMTGWGQDGPMAARAGHDINYIAMAGPLAHIGRAGQPPTPPLNLVGDFGGGGLLLAVGVMAALVERSVSGLGQVVDAAMVDGAALLCAPIATAYAGGWFHAERGTNWLDSGAHFYEVYATADGRWMSVGAIEPQFYAALIAVLALDADPDNDPLPDQNDESQWPAMKARMAACFAARTLDEWVAAFDGVDACVAPVRAFGDVLADPHVAARGTWTEIDGVLQPAPAPRFSRTPAVLDLPPPAAGQHTDEALGDWGFDATEIASLRSAGAIA